MSSVRKAALWAAVFAVFAGAGSVAPAFADGGVTFTDVATQAGITWKNGSTAREAARQAIIDSTIPNPNPTVPGSATGMLRVNSPLKASGAPGVAVFDFDNDGDLDLYATNTLNNPNGLLKNSFAQDGTVTFTDVAGVAGVAAMDQESTGVCVGDVDNDGDLDLFVTGLATGHKLFRNNGNSTFSDITVPAGVTGPHRYSIGCAMGDVNGDGRLDVVVGNTFNNWSHRSPIFGPNNTYNMMEHNELYINQGTRRAAGIHGRFSVFTEEGEARGLHNVTNMNQPGLSGAAFTWAISMADADGDGDIDVFSGDQQGPPATQASERRGWNRIFDNDGTGHFTDLTETNGLMVDNSWMGYSFGDVNCDGTLDFFSTGNGSYIGGPGFQSSLFTRNADGTYHWANQNATDPIGLNPFGWGTVMIDYDNDADSDIIYHGQMDITNLIAKDNPGVVFTNTGVCSGIYSWNRTALTADHLHRSVEGVATGDLNGDGFFDIVTVSSLDITPGSPFFVPFTRLTGPIDPGGFDTVASFQNILTGRTFPGFLVPVSPQPTFTDGGLAVELNSADNGNGWVKVKVIGGAGIIDDRRSANSHRPDPEELAAHINRNGIGSTVKFTPAGGPTSMQPIVAGSSYSSNNALEIGFGLGAATSGVLDVITPGGYKNRLYDVAASETVRFPLVPCSFDDPQFRNRGQYLSCVFEVLREYRREGAITHAEQNRFFNSARQAWNEEH